MNINDTYNWEEKTILIAEDEEINYILLVELLAQTNAKILHASDGIQAVNLCKEFNRR